MDPKIRGYNCRCNGLYGPDGLHIWCVLELEDLSRTLTVHLVQKRILSGKMTKKITRKRSTAILRRSEAKKRRRSQITIKSLSKDILSGIFLKLQAKSLFSVRNVCTTWRSIVDDPDFVKAHLHASKRCLLFQSCMPGRLYSISMLLLQIRRGRNRVYQLHHSLESYRKAKLLIRASCDGLILLESVDERKLLVVANPTMDKSIKLPELYLVRAEMAGKFNYYGFAFDRFAKKYKVVRFFRDKSKQPRCMILTIGSDTWRQIRPPHLNAHLNFHPVSTSGAVHWVTTDKKLLFNRILDPSNDCVMSLDIASEEFRAIKPPDIKGRCYLLEVSGALGLLHCNSPYEWDVWVTRDYCSWEKINTVFVIGPKLRRRIYPITSLDHGNQIIFKECRATWLYLYDDELLKLKKIKAHAEYMVTRPMAGKVNSESIKKSLKYFADLPLAHTNSIVWWDTFS